jgi:hypothetical protein
LEQIGGRREEREVFQKKKKKKKERKRGWSKRGTFEECKDRQTDR